MEEGESMARSNNYPQASLDAIPAEGVKELVSSLRELYEAGRPKTDEEVAERVDQYFLFCQESSIRPGIESLCMALHIGRTTLFDWAKGNGCSKERQEIIQAAKSFISAYIEQAMLGGKINPPSGIFLMKNWLGYKDTVSIEENLPERTAKTSMSLEDIQARLNQLRTDK